MKQLTNKYRNFFVVLVMLLILVFLRTDYRFIEKPICCGDDHDYFSHSETLIIDFDFDYSNQLKGFEEKRFVNKNKIAPKGFIGTGIFAAPFLLLGSLIDEVIFKIFQRNTNSLMNYKLLLYSLSSIFYFFSSIFLTSKTLDNLNIKSNNLFLTLIYAGSGISYFAFERYSMTHVFEVFTVSGILYLSSEFYSFNQNNKSKYSFLIPLGICFSLLVRWTNYYVLFLPLIFKLLFTHQLSKEKLTNKISFYISSLISIAIFLFINFKTYGIWTINPSVIYGNAGEKIENYIQGGSEGFTFISENIIYIVKILFSQEFGIFWFSPIIFVGALISLYFIFQKKVKNSLKILLFLTFSQVFAMVLVWSSTASSYGYRYLYSVVPLCVLIIYATYSSRAWKFTYSYVYFFSFIGLFGVLFFETSELTSLRNQVNIFGELVPYNQSQYLFGVVQSIFNLNSYLIIFSTSFLGAIFFKIMIMALNIQEINLLFSNLGLPVENSDFQNLLLNIQEVSFDKFLMVIFITYLFSRKLLEYNR